MSPSLAMHQVAPVGARNLTTHFTLLSRIKHKYDSRTMKGFAGELDDDLKAEFEKHPAVKYVG